MKETPKGGYRPPKTGGWGMVIGLIVALILTMVMIVGGPWLVANRMRYFEADVQGMHRDMYGE